MPLVIPDLPAAKGSIRPLSARLLEALNRQEWQEVSLLVQQLQEYSKFLHTYAVHQLELKNDRSDNR